MSVIQYPYLQKDLDAPKAILGMFDVSARPYVPEDRLTFAVPMSKLVSMMDNMEESFLITESWHRLRGRIERGQDHQDAC